MVHLSNSINQGKNNMKKQIMYNDKKFTICTCDCHVVGHHLKHIVPCCDVCYKHYLTAVLIMKDGSQIAPCELNKENSHFFSHMGNKGLDLSLLEKALEEEYDFYINNLG